MTRFLLTLALVLISSIAPAAEHPGKPRTEHVFIISIDGGSPPVIRDCEMPVLKNLVKEGSHTWDASTIRPSLTLPSHTSMLTGVEMAKHGVTWNNLSSSNGIVEFPTIFTIAKKAGYSTAMFVGKEKFRHLLQTNSVDEFGMDEKRAVEISKSESGVGEMKKEKNLAAKPVAAAAIKHIRAHKPNLCFIHFADADTTGHLHGWGSPEQIKALAEIDKAIGAVTRAIRKAGLAKKSVILISADHGGQGKGHSLGRAIDMQIPWIAWGEGVKRGHKITEPVKTTDTAATALWLLGLEPIKPLDGKVVESAFKASASARSRR